MRNKFNQLVVKWIRTITVIGLMDPILWTHLSQFHCYYVCMYSIIFNLIRPIATLICLMQLRQFDVRRVIQDQVLIPNRVHPSLLIYVFCSDGRVGLTAPSGRENSFSSHNEQHKSFRDTAVREVTSFGEPFKSSINSKLIINNPPPVHRSLILYRR